MLSSEIYQLSSSEQLSLIDRYSTKVNWDEARKALRIFPSEQDALLKAFPGLIYVGSRVAALRKHLCHPHMSYGYNFQPGRDTDFYTTAHYNLNLLSRRYIEHCDTKLRCNTYEAPKAVISLRGKYRHQPIEIQVHDGIPGLHPAFQWALLVATLIDPDYQLCAIPLTEGYVRLVYLPEIRHVPHSVDTICRTVYEVRSAILNMLSASCSYIEHESNLLATCDPDLEFSLHESKSISHLFCSKVRSKDIFPELLMQQMGISGIAQVLAKSFSEHHCWAAGYDMYYLFLRFIERTESGNWGIDSIDENVANLYYAGYQGRMRKINIQKFLQVISQADPETFKKVELIERWGPEFALGRVMRCLDNLKRKRREQIHSMFRNNYLKPENWLGYPLLEQR